MFGAEKVMATKAAQHKSAPRSTRLGPNQDTKSPFARMPKKAPTPEASLIPACQAAVN